MTMSNNLQSDYIFEGDVKVMWLFCVFGGEFHPLGAQLCPHVWRPLPGLKSNHTSKVHKILIDHKVCCYNVLKQTCEKSASVYSER